jgi:hypothetical protein
VENIDDDAGDEDQGERSPPKVKGGMTTRRHAASTANPDEPKDDVMESVAVEGESSRREALPT